MANVLSMDQALVEKLNDILESNLEKEHFGVKELSQELGLSRSQLHRKLKYLTNKTPSRYIREFRLKKAMIMLQNNEATASEIAYRVGFNSPTYFNTCFHDYYGYPPGEVKFRNNNNGNQSNSIRTKIPRIENRFNILSQKVIWIFALVILLFSVFGYKLYQHFNGNVVNEVPLIDNMEKSIAIIPFKNLSDNPENQYFADGVAGAIQNNLNNISGINVIASSSMEKYRNTNLSANEIGNAVDVKYLLEGSVQKHGDSIRVLTHLISTQDNRQLRSFLFDWEYKNVFEIQNKIAFELAEELNLGFSPEKIAQINKRPTKNIDAYELYTKGRFYWNKGNKSDLLHSISLYNQAIQLDSAYAEAYSGLADSFFILGWYGYNPQKESFITSKQYALKALSLDNNLAETHANLGAIATWFELDWEEAERRFKRTIELNPNYDIGHFWYAEYLEIVNRISEAIFHMEKAIQLDNTSYNKYCFNALLYLKAGNYDRSIIEAAKAKKIDLSNGWAEWIIYNCYRIQGRDDEAIAELVNYFELNSRNQEALNYRNAFEKNGITGVHKFIIEDDLKKGIAELQPIITAEHCAILGENENALNWIEKAFLYQEQGIWKKHNMSIIKIKSNPFFKNLRSEPRFLAILDKLNLGGYD